MRWNVSTSTTRYRLSLSIPYLSSIHLYSYSFPAPTCLTSTIEIHTKEGPKLLEQIKDARVRDSLKLRRRRITVLNPDGNEDNPTPEEDYCSC